MHCVLGRAVAAEPLAEPASGAVCEVTAAAGGRVSVAASRAAAGEAWLGLEEAWEKDGQRPEDKTHAALFSMPAKLVEATAY
jgi:hypothetical protein